MRKRSLTLVFILLSQSFYSHRLLPASIFISACAPKFKAAVSTATSRSYHYLRQFQSRAPSLITSMTSFAGIDIPFKLNKEDFAQQVPLISLKIPNKQCK